MLVACGGTTILAETTEIYGAEHLLTRRAARRAVADKLIERIKWWVWYAGMFGAETRQQSVGRQQGRRASPRSTKNRSARSPKPARTA